MPPSPRLDLPFLILAFCAVVFNIMTVIYYRKARCYKRQIEEHNRQSNKTSASFSKPHNSPADTTTTNSQSKGSGIF